MKIKESILLIFLITIGCIISLALGVIADWDFANYHYYSVWALFHNRIGFDIMPCGIQSYFNPLIDIPLYLAIKFFNDKCYLITILLSFSWGICVFLIYKIAQLVFDGKYREQLVFFSVLIGATGVLSTFGIGLSFGDLGITSFSLLALFIFLKNIFLPDSPKRSFMIFLSALLIGFSVGLKTSGSMFTVGVIGAEIVYAFKFPRAVKIIFLTLIGILLGILITGGWWYYIVYSHFGNPFFPFRNDLYLSPLAATMSFLDTRYLPQSILQEVFYPIVWTFSKNRCMVANSDFFDIRWVLLYFSLFILILGRFLSCFKKKVQNIMNLNIMYFLTAIIVINYIFWLKTSSILRYVLNIEFLSGIFIFAVFYILVDIFKIKQSRIKLILGCIFSIFILFSTQYFFPKDLRTYKREKILDLEDFNLPDDSVLLYVGGFPGAIYMPFQNPKSRFIYLYGEMDNYNFVYGPKYIEEIRNIIKKADNKVYVLFSDCDFAYTMWKDNGVVDLDKEDFSCRLVGNNFNQKYYFCSLKEGRTIKIEE